MRAKAICWLLACICLHAAGATLITANTPDGLLVHWTFDELVDGTFADVAGGELITHVEGGASVTDGVFGAALRLEGRPAIRVQANEAFADLPGLTISAWVRPSELSGYREVFRK